MKRLIKEKETEKKLAEEHANTVKSKKGVSRPAITKR